MTEYSPGRCWLINYSSKQWKHWRRQTYKHPLFKMENKISAKNYVWLV